MTKAQLEKSLNDWIAITVLRTITDWYGGESDFSDDTPTSYAKDTLDALFRKEPTK